MSNILLADKDDLACLGIEYIFEIIGMNDLDVLRLTNGLDVIGKIKEGDIDVLLMDLKLDGCDGFTVLSMLKNLKLKVPVVVFSAVEDIKVIKQVLNLGADAFVSKNADNEFLGEAIESVLSGKKFISEHANNCLELDQLKSKKTYNSKLFFKENELIILKLLMDGLTTKEIANYMYLSPRTVEGQRARLMKKTKTKSMLELAKFISDNNLKLIGKN